MGTRHIGHTVAVSLLRDALSVMYLADVELEEHGQLRDRLACQPTMATTCAVERLTGHAGAVVRCRAARAPGWEHGLPSAPLGRCCPPGQPQQADRQVAQAGHHLRAAGGPDPAAVLGEDGVADPVQALDPLCR